MKNKIEKTLSPPFGYSISHFILFLVYNSNAFREETASLSCV